MLAPAFIEGQRGRIFALLRRPAVRRAAGCVLIVPPFAEEMNKTRPMLTMVAHRLSEYGIATVLPDLFGTGDSAGEFRDCDWDAWQDDLLRAAHWAEAQGFPVSDLLCVRLGCILGAQVSRKLQRPIGRTVLWQPVLDGQRFMTQFLRLRVAASMMDDRRETVGDLRDRLNNGEAIEVAGYELSLDLVTQIDAARLQPWLNDHLGRVHWIEIVRGEYGTVPSQSAQAIEGARPALRSIRSQAVLGEPFWSATEIVRIPELIKCTVNVLTEAA